MPTYANQIAKLGWKWIKKQPKNNFKKEEKKLPSKLAITSANKYAQMHQIWVPKQLLQAQNYYSGKTLLWLPKKIISKPQIRQ